MKRSVEPDGTSNEARRARALLSALEDLKMERHRLAAEVEHRQRVERQLRGLADAGLAISGSSPLSEILQDVTDRARELIGAHQAYTSFAIDQKTIRFF